MNRRIVCATAVLAGLLFLTATMRPAIAAPRLIKHQMIASVVLRQNTNEARVTLSVVDLGPSHKYRIGIFRRGVILADDAGRMIAIRGDAVLERQDRTFQIFQFGDMHLDMPGRKVIRVTHISLLVFSGDDWEHPAETAVCGSPSFSIDACLEQWKTTD